MLDTLGIELIHTTNSKTLPYPAEEIWGVLTDFANYPKWWPSSIKIKVTRIEPELVHSQIEVKPYGGQRFTCEVTGYSNNSELQMKYSGIYSGTGIWTLSEINGQCSVTYEILLEIESAWIRLLSRILPVAKIHSKLMDEVLSGLDKHVGLIKRHTKPGVATDWW